jgi:glycosyltransferase involved in cell wall biosynthesis
VTVAPGRVLLVSHHGDIVGGGEISLLTLIAGLVARGWQVTLAVPGQGPLARAAAERGALVEVKNMPTLRRPGGSLLRAVRELRSLARSLRPDVVHANGTRAMFYAGMAARAIACPAVWHLRIVDPDPIFDVMLIRLADAVIATSEAARARLRRWPEALRACRVIPNGLDLSAFAAERSRRDVRDELGIPDEDVVVMSVGRLVDFKRFDLLLDAIAHLRRRVPGPLRCVIVGSGPHEAALRQRAQREDLAGTVTLTGHRDDVADLLGAADVFVLTSPVESFGRVLIEAMAMSLPVVAPHSGGPAEIVRDGEDGLLVAADHAAAFEAAIERLALDGALRRQLGTAGRARVEHSYSMEAHAGAVVRLYDELRGGPGSER